tara:strand:- start:575 stop:925 length:351 start_codon:yes stop_codon:yes gene_type:complete
MTMFSGWNNNNNKPMTKKEKRLMEKMWKDFKRGSANSTTWQQQHQQRQMPPMQQATYPGTSVSSQMLAELRQQRDKQNVILHRVSKKSKLLQHENEWLRKDRIRLKKKLKETEELL